MNERDFCYWIRGFFELSNTDYLDKHQVELIKKHLELVFENKTQPVDNLADLFNPDPAFAPKYCSPGMPGMSC